MNTNQKKLRLIKEGFKTTTLENFNDKQIDSLYNRLMDNRKKINEVQTVTSTKLIATPDEIKKGVSLQGKTMAKMMPDGKVEFTEDSVVDKDNEDEGTISQSPKQVQAPDGMDDNSDVELQEKFQSKAQQRYFYSRCNDKSQSKKIREKWCRMADESEKKTNFDKIPEHRGESNENFSLKDYTKKVGSSYSKGLSDNLTKSTPNVTIEESELEQRIMKLVEKHISPKMSKKDFLNLIGESEVAPAKPRVKPTTKPGTDSPYKPKPGVKPAPKAKKEFKENTEVAPAKPRVKPTTKPGTDSPYKPKPGVKPAPKAVKKDLPTWLSFDNLGLNIK